MHFEFGDFAMDTRLRELSERGVPVHLTPKAFDLLAFLIERRAGVVGKAAIHEAIWKGAFVDECNVAVLIAEIRRALHDEAKEPRFIKTVHRVGYRFIDAQPAAPVRVRSAAREYALVSGENIVGRDPAARVRINAPGISRQHARITVAETGVVIEDLGSKNGTYVDGRRVTGPSVLHDGSEIRLSREVLRVSMAADSSSTITDVA